MKDRVTKIVSGGQTGVDRAALDVAIYTDIPHGGWCPLDRRAEDGPIPSTYRMQETGTRDYAERTEKNVVDSDGTLILHFNELSGGTRLTAKLARRHHRPFHCIDLAELHEPSSETASPLPRMVRETRAWIEDNNICVLNVAGPRESTRPGIGRLAEQVLVAIFSTDFHPAAH